MNGYIAGMLAGLALAGGGAAKAQEPPTFQELTQEIGERVEALERTMHERQAELVRRVRLLEILARGADALAREAPMTGRDSARQAVADAREVAGQEPVLDRGVFQALERADAELLRSGPGSPPGAAAARFLAALLPLEQTTNDALGAYLSDAQRLLGLAASMARAAESEHARGAQALNRLLRVHAMALEARGAAAP